MARNLRREPTEARKATLASILRKSRHGVRLNDHLEHDCGLTVFQHACKMVWKGSNALPVWAFTGSAQIQESGSTGCEAGAEKDCRKGGKL
jgi:hypothetical protein